MNERDEEEDLTNTNEKKNDINPHGFNSGEEGIKKKKTRKEMRKKT